VATQPMIPSTFLVASLAKVLARLRGAQHTPTNIQYSRHINIHNGSTPTMPLYAKFSLLPYIIENWLFHTIGFVYDRDRPTLSRHSKRWALFTLLALEKKLLFNFRPWDCNKLQRQDIPYALQIGWALSTNHVPLLVTIVTYSPRPIEQYLEFAANWVFPEYALSNYIPEKWFQELHRQNLESFPSGEWGGWMYCRLIGSCNQDGTDALIFCLLRYRPNNSMPSRSSLKLLGHMLLEAARYGQVSLIRTLLGILSIWSTGGALEDIFCITTDCAGQTCNAIQVATLCGHVDIVNLLTTAGCPVA